MGLVGSEKSYGKMFFVVSQLFVVIALYSLVDEFMIRRPWKAYQHEYYQLETKLLQKELSALNNKFAADKVEAQIKQKEKALEDAFLAKESDDYKKLQKEYAELKNRFDDKDLGIKIDKSFLDAYYYEYKHAYQTGHDYKDKKKKFDDLEADLIKRNKELAEDAKKLAAAKAGLDNYDSKIKEIETQIEKLKEPLVAVKEKINQINTIPIDANIKQIVTEFGRGGNIYWPRIDRCQTCHLNADKAGYEDVVKKFQLTVVDASQIGSTEKLSQDQIEAKIKATIKEIESKDSSKKGFVVSKAKQEYLQTMYGTHPRREELFGNHPVEKFGCTSCHGGEGRALRIQGEPLGHGDKVHAYHHHAIEPLLRDMQTESNCLSCHNGQIYVPGAPHLTQGLNLFVEMGCQGCHKVAGYEKLYKVGPGLTKVAEKVKTDWLVDWIKNPHQYMPNARMPNFGLTEEEVVGVSSYLLANSSAHKLESSYAGGGDAANGKIVFEKVGCLACHSADFEETNKRQRAPNLSRITAKVKSAEWLYDWIKNPKNYDLHTRMPSLRLTDSEAKDLTAYMWSSAQKDYPQIIEKRSGQLAAKVNPQNNQLVAKGQAVISERGCYACHDIKGFENSERVGPELTAEALKEAFEFDFGDSLKEGFVFKDAEGKKILVTHKEEKPAVKTAEINKHDTLPEGIDATTNVVYTWQSWVRNKILYPLGVYSHQRGILKMPQFKLFPEEVDSLVVFLKGLKGMTVDQQFNASKQPFAQEVLAGQAIISEGNCMGCHNINDFGGDINPHVDEYVKNHISNPLEVKRYYPPSLESVGMKIRPEWLVSFLEDPKVYRPNVFLRMPTYGFDKNELNVLADYFAGMSKQNVHLSKTDYVLNPEDVKIGQILAGNDVFNCYSCHLMDGKAPGYNRPANESAPDLAKTADRLQYDFITKWIKNSALYQKYSAMPGFLASNDDAHPDYYKGDAQKQLEALRAYILSLKPGVSQKLQPASERKTQNSGGIESIIQDASTEQ